MIVTKSQIQKELPLVSVESNLRISYNTAPTQHGYIVTNESPNRLQYFTWGLIPYWSSEGKNSGKLINARKEGIESKPSFRLPIRQRRCLVLADSFYEWRREGKEKIPYRIFLKNKRLMLMAGVWDEWQKGNYIIKSFSIITTAANVEMSGVHNRMPVILGTQEKQKNWLETSKLSDTLSLLQTLPDDNLSMYRVPVEVGSVKNNSPILHTEIPIVPTLF